MRATPRPYLVPPLPTDIGAARAQGTQAALAFAIAAARRAVAGGTSPPEDCGELFTESLHALIRQALSELESGDAPFRALVQRARHRQVDDYLRLQAQSVVDQRAVRSAVDVVAHPGKLARPDTAAAAHHLAPLHVLARQGSWAHLWQRVQALVQSVDDPAVHRALAPLMPEGPLARLRALQGLVHDPQVQRYLSLCAAQGPVAGSPEAQAQGRASAHVGDQAEAVTWQVFQEAATRLAAIDVGGASWQAVRSLRMPRGFPGESAKAKDEWDVALLRREPGTEGADLVLLAEVKASPSSATSDLARLLRGLQRLALAEPGNRYTFACLEGSATLRGESLRALAPPGPALPEPVIYCCAAPPDTPPFLSAASQSVLLAEPASIEHGRRLLEAREAPLSDLAQVWQALPHAPRLRATLFQWETLRVVRASMLMPQDLSASLRSCTPG